MKILATYAVIIGSEINVLYKEKEFWLLLSKKEMDEKYQFDENNLYIIEDEHLFGRIPALRGKLEQPEKTTIFINYGTGEININKQHLHLGIPTHVATATRQADAGFDLVHFLKITKSRYTKFLIIAPLLLLLSVFYSWIFYIPLIIYAVLSYLVIAKTRDMYFSGALGPAIVIDAATSTFAALSDLSQGYGSYPVIRIVKYPIPEEYLQNGTKIPFAGAYQVTEDYDFWNYFEPQPLPTGIKNKALIQDKIHQIPTIEWVELKNEIKKFKEIPKVGYYPINIENSSWKDVDIDTITWV